MEADTSTGAAPRSRRALLAGALGGLGAVAAAMVGRVTSVRGADGDPVILGASNRGGNTTIETGEEFQTALALQGGVGLDSFGGFKGVRGRSVGEIGVEGLSENGPGVLAHSENGNALIAESLGDARQSAVWGSSTRGRAIRGTSDGGWAGWFDGRIYSSGFIELAEMPTPGRPAHNRARLFVRDNGANHTQLCVRFPNGTIRVLATA